MTEMARRRQLLLVSLTVLAALCVHAQENGAVCTASTGDASHCICNTPNGVIDVTSLGNADGTPKYSAVGTPAISVHVYIQV